MISKELLNELLDNTVDKRMTPIISDYNGHIVIYYRSKDNIPNQGILIYELAFRARDYFKTKNKNLSLNQSIEDIFIEANTLYNSLK